MSEQGEQETEADVLWPADPEWGEYHPEKPSLSQVLDAAPMLHWRKCWGCGRIALHVENFTPWVRCRRCGSQDTRCMQADSALLHAGR